MSPCTSTGTAAPDPTGAPFGQVPAVGTVDAMSAPSPDFHPDRVADDLVELTRAISLADPTIELSAGFLGGRYGYGARCDNEVFTMHPYCWCDQDDCAWCWGCVCPDGATVYLDPEGVRTDADTFYDNGGYTWGTTRQVPELVCDFCRGERLPAPNFSHAASGVRVFWYKYLGRGMRVEVPEGCSTSWDDILAECRTWLAAHRDSLTHHTAP